jgi:cell division protein FtsA
VLPIGAGHFTNDLAMVLRTPFAEAERIKIKSGCCLARMVGDDEGIAVPSVAGGGERVVPRRELCAILQPRAEELFALVRDDLDKHGFTETLRGGVVLTGGGSQLDGLLELAEQIFDTGVRYGLPQGLGGLADVISSPTWAAASGLLLYGRAAEQGKEKKRRPGFSVRAVMGSLRGMFEDLL